MGISSRAIARQLHLGPNTVRRYRDVLDRVGLLAGPAGGIPTLEELRDVVAAELPARVPRHQTSSVAPSRARIEALWAQGLSARAIFDRLRIEVPDGAPPFGGTYPAVKRIVRGLKLRSTTLAIDVAIPVETRPGETAQVDFGYAGKLFDPHSGTLRRAWFFVMVMCHSRHMFVQLVFDQKIETWIDLHMRALAAFGGVPSCLVPDNGRNAVKRAAFALDGPTELNRSYRELAQFYGFKIDPSPPGKPWTKGVAEAAVKYVKASALKGRQGQRIQDVQAALDRWNREVAGVRIHGTTGLRPIDAFEGERLALRPLPAIPYDPVIWKAATVHPDCHVALRGHLYSVPWQLVHQKVSVRASTREVAIDHGGRCVATHERSTRWRTTNEAHLPPARRDLRHRSRDVWEDRAQRIGPETLGLVRGIFEADPVLSRLRRVQAIVTHLERFPRARAEAALCANMK
jgi:DNA-binding CsgD family transcriptional regulator